MFINKQAPSRINQTSDQITLSEELQVKLDDSSAKLKSLSSYGLAQNSAYAAKAVSDVEALQGLVPTEEGEDSVNSGQKFGGGNQMTGEQAAQTLLENLKYLDVAAGDKDQAFGLADLKAIIEDNPGLPQELRDAADFLIKNPAVFKAIDSGIGGLDGKISSKDLEAFLANETSDPDTDPNPSPNTKLTAHKAIQTLLDHYDEIVPKVTGTQRQGLVWIEKEVSGPLSHELLQELRNDPSLSQEVREALGYLLDNPSLLRMMDADRLGRTDGNVTKDRLESFIENVPESEWNKPSTPVEDHNVISVAKVLLRYMGLVGRKGMSVLRPAAISRGSLEHTLKSNADLPEELQTAIEHLFQNSRAFDRLDAATSKNGRKDGSIERNDLLKVING